jgi:hypothetical protein
MRYNRAVWTHVKPLYAAFAIDAPVCTAIIGSDGGQMLLATIFQKTVQMFTTTV